MKNRQPTDGANPSRRQFIQRCGVLGGIGLTGGWPVERTNGPQRILPVAKQIRVQHTSSNFEREPLIRPFGFKGGYLTDLWQTAARLQSESGLNRVGICTQNVLYADAAVFESYSEAAGNALMYALTDFALKRVSETPFTSPVELLEQILPAVYEAGKKLTGRSELNKIFALNALIGVDNAAWLLYAAENKLPNFDGMVPAAYKPALSHHNAKVAIVYMVSYGLPIEAIKKAAADGYFVIKLKIGQPGTQAEMLSKDKARLTQVHQEIQNAHTQQTTNGKLIYSLDANGRYEKKETLLQLLDHARKIGAFDQIQFIEEPLIETNEEHVADVGIRIAADESVHDEAGALRRLEQGYQAIVLKGIAKTLSLSMKVAQLAHERGIPCLCADLTVNPILVDWHKNLAARLAPFPGIGMGLLETNGDVNYRNWRTMQTYHPTNGAPWTEAKNGVFELGADFYARSGGILEPSDHYEALFSHEK
ncbi:MAG: L-alanine-DL-glutamate epimerase [Bacteroidetes bacterium]|nr:L-alanine-DL-glutamate epimerase [Fibrella sp.]